MGTSAEVNLLRCSYYIMGAFHLRRLAGNIAGKLGNAYLRYQIASWRRAFHYNGNTGKAGDTVYKFCRLNGKRPDSRFTYVKSWPTGN